MSYNDQDSHHLLTWINQERQVIGQANKIYQFQQLQFSSLIPLLLQQIDHHYFHHIIERDFDFKLYLLTIEKYLNEEEDLKFKRHQRQILQDQESISSLVKIILFLIMRRQIKKQFVPRILQLEEGSQMYLMCEIRRVETWLENRVQIKQVHQTIEKLEEENESLNRRLKEMEAKNMHARTIRSQLQHQNKKLQQQKKENNSQKAEIIDQLGINHPKEYMAVYKELIVQRNELISSHQRVQSQIVTLSQQNQEMRDKIAQNAFIIEHLNGQISKYRQIYSRLKKSALSFTKADKQNIDVTSLTFESVRMVQSIQCNKGNQNDQHARTIEEFQEDETLCNLTFQAPQQDLASKLQEMYAKIRVLNQQIYCIKLHNEKIAHKNRAKQRILRQASEQFGQFSFNYAFTVNR